MLGLTSPGFNSDAVSSPVERSSPLAGYCFHAYMAPGTCDSRALKTPSRDCR